MNISFSVNNFNFNFERGVARRLDSLPPRSIALDGYVQGPEFDAQTERYSFDHHAGCVRHATLSTCEMVRDALRVGLDPRGFAVFVNDWDADTVMACWLLANSQDIYNIEGIVHRLGRLDALGPASGITVPPGILHAWKELFERDWRSKSDDEQAACIKKFLEVPWFELAWGEDEDPPPVVVNKILGDIYESPEPFGAFGELYRRGVRFAVLANRREDGTMVYTIGKQSEFVPGNIPAILGVLRSEEIANNPAQSPAHNWGGGTTIGGSPRNPDGTASRLTPGQVQAVIDRWMP